MLQNLAAEIINCYERARLAHEKAERAINDEFKAEFLASEGRWLALALSYERQHQLSRTIAEFDRRKKVGPITRTLWEKGLAFDPHDVARLAVAYRAVLHQLGLTEREDGATLMVATRIIDLASQGELDSRAFDGSHSQSFIRANWHPDGARRLASRSNSLRCVRSGGD